MLAVTFGVIHGAVGTFEQSVRIVAVLGMEGDTDARADRELMSIDDKGIGEGRQYFFGDSPCAV